MFYKHDPSHPCINNIEKRSILARTILLEICKLMIENDMELVADMEQDWCRELIKNDHIRLKMNILVNLVAD